MVCLVCPKSCALLVAENGGTIKTENNRCGRGAEFARKELTDPERTLTSTIRIRDGTLPLVSVRSDAPVKKAELKSLIKRLDGMTVQAPMRRGQIVLRDAGVNKVSIIATRTVERRENSEEAFHEKDNNGNRQSRLHRLHHGSGINRGGV
jgi:CxxC motif-containing protein